jgi:hypothetical protein
MAGTQIRLRSQAELDALDVCRDYWDCLQDSEAYRRALYTLALLRRTLDEDGGALELARGDGEWSEIDPLDREAALDVADSGTRLDQDKRWTITLTERDRARRVAIKRWLGVAAMRTVDAAVLLLAAQLIEHSRAGLVPWIVSAGDKYRWVML